MGEAAALVKGPRRWGEWPSMTNYDDFRDWRRRSRKYEREMDGFTIGDPKDAMIEAEQKAWGDLGNPGLDHYYAGVYFIACGPHIKIGKTGNHPYERMEDFHTGNPYLLELLHVIAIDDEA
ncbi:hypothetical protein Q0Z83_031790 [Actinoplanes sichuanensis]|nr:hypothetical protein Q0Z83_031790 [Actinoplanes sichuanensis]